MLTQFSALYPPKNRRTNPLSVIHIEIASQGKVQRLDMNQAAMAAHFENLDLGEPGFPSDISGEPGYEYRSSEITLALTQEELYRLMRHDLRPPEYFKLVETFGVCFELHDDFYDESSGVALQPQERASD